MKTVENTNNQNNPKKKKTNKIETDQNIALSDEILKQLDTKLSQTLKNEFKRRKPKLPSDYKMLETILLEYLKSFIVIGFNMNGEKVFIGHAKTAEQHDSLIEHLRQTFFNVIENIIEQ